MREERIEMCKYRLVPTNKERNLKCLDMLYVGFAIGAAKDIIITTGTAAAGTGLRKEFDPRKISDVFRVQALI